MTTTTLKHWQRRALAAEAEVEQLRGLRTFDKNGEMRMSRQVCTATVALKEAREAIEWALGEMDRAELRVPTWRPASSPLHRWPRTAGTARR